MRKSVIISFILMLFTLSMSPTVMASDKGKPMNHTGHVGEKIHESSVKGYHLAYHLLSLPGRDAQHLMTYIIDTKGQAVTKAKVGYLVVGPDGAKQQVMAMAMKDSFGGDVNFTTRGMYTIKSKAIVGNDKLMDRFTFEVK